ncbi:MAG: hypothetical protein ABIS06_18190 [Vicinamibacterales bacterium]
MRNRTLVILLIVVAFVAITAYATHQGGSGRLTTFLKSMHGPTGGH